MRIVLINGSPRAEDNCPQQESKQSLLIKEIISHPYFNDLDVQFDVIDLAVREKSIQPCKGCISTAAPLCCYPCNCYSPNDLQHPDQMHDDKIYSRLESCHGFMVLTPIHWYGPSSVVKLMFDRLVCASGGNPRPDLIDGKNVEKARELQRLPMWRQISKNHLGGKYAAFWAMGDSGADEIGADGRPKILQDKKLFNPGKELHFNDPVHTIMPLVWQCRYSGIHVPDDLIDGLHINQGLPYSEANKAFVLNDEPWNRVLALVCRLVEYVEKDIEHIDCHISQIHQGHPFEDFCH